MTRITPVHHHAASWMILYFLVASGHLFAGCDLYGQDEFEEDYVVESYLIALQPLPEIKISKSIPFNKSYRFEENSVSGAAVRLHRYNEEGQKEYSYLYQMQSPGIYSPDPADSTDRIKPRKTYRLEIAFPDEPSRHIHATTTVPDTFSVRQVVRDRAIYQDEKQLEFTISRNRSDGRQLYFIYATESMNPVEENMTPFWKQAVDDPEEARRIRTTIVNEENFDVNEDGTLTLRMPWIGIAFYGENIISTFSLDDNTYDFFRSQPVQAGGGPGTLSPGEIQNIIYNIDGAIGLFGSMSVLESRVYVERPSLNL